MSLSIKQLVVGQLRANCYLIWDEETGDGMVIDPGDDADYIARVIADENVSPRVLVATHGHFDHIGAVNELKLSYSIPFLIQEEDEFLVRRMRESARHFTRVDPGPAPTIDGYLDDTLLFTKTLFQIIKTPGHTPGSVALYSQKNGVAFVGDVIFTGGAVGRTDFSYSSAEDLEKSIKMLLHLPPETTLYSGHGEVTTIADVVPFFS